MRTAITEKDFDTLAELTMKDSNNFHAVCRDTFPTINYLNETSEFIIRCVENLNSLSKDFELKNKYLVIKNFVFNFLIRFLIHSMLGRMLLFFIWMK